MNYEQYADAMNAHADACPQCDLSRKTGKTRGVCEVAQGIIAEWMASPKTEEDTFFAIMNKIAHEMKEVEVDEPKD